MEFTTEQANFLLDLVDSYGDEFAESLGKPSGFVESLYDSCVAMVNR